MQGCVANLSSDNWHAIDTLQLQIPAASVSIRKDFLNDQYSRAVSAAQREDNPLDKNSKHRDSQHRMN